MISTRRILTFASVPLLLLVGALGGAALTRHSMNENARSEDLAVLSTSGEKFGKISDVIREGFSSRVKVKDAEANAAPDALTNEAKQIASDEAYLRSVSYPALKRIYFERQDQEREKLNSHFDVFDEKDPESRKKHADAVFRKYVDYGDKNSHFLSSGEWKLRNGKNVPYIAIASFYSSVASPAGAEEDGSFQGSVASALTGEEMCFGISYYLKIGNKYASQGGSSCLGYGDTRGGRPYINQGVYQQKELLPYFDWLNLPVPGFGPDSEVEAEWYDSSKQVWTSLGSLRWDPISKEESKRRTKELEHESMPD